MLTPAKIAASSSLGNCVLGTFFRFGTSSCPNSTTDGWQDRFQENGNAPLEASYVPMGPKLSPQSYRKATHASKKRTDRFVRLFSRQARWPWPAGRDLRPRKTLQVPRIAPPQLWKSYASVHLPLRPGNHAVVLGLSILAIVAIPALFGWRWRKVSYAVSNRRFPCTSPVRIPRDVSPCLLKTELFNLPWCGQRRSYAHHG